ncbi:MAG: hypothetical protein IKP73_09610 [Bacteroidales bacterium]|jgi:hypothetical protein|nr:hypothetical protein [Bacteroidales bacterium]
MTQKISSNAVADVATQRKQYVPPQIEVVELDNQGAILMASNRSFGAGFDGGIDEEDI